MNPDQKSIDILTHLANGLTIKEIAYEVGMKKENLRKKMRKMRVAVGAKNSTELVAHAFKNGILPAVNGQ